MAQYYSLPGGGTTTSLSTAQAAYKDYNKAQNSAPVSSPAPAPTTESGGKTGDSGGLKPGEYYVYTLPDGGTTRNQAIAENAWAAYNKQKTRQEVISGGVMKTSPISPEVVPTVVSRSDYTFMGGQLSPKTAVYLYTGSEGFRTIKVNPEGIATTLTEKPRGTYTAAPKTNIFQKAGGAIATATEYPRGILASSQEQISVGIIQPAYNKFPEAFGKGAYEETKKDIANAEYLYKQLGKGGNTGNVFKDTVYNQGALPLRAGLKAGILVAGVAQTEQEKIVYRPLQFGQDVGSGYVLGKVLPVVGYGIDYVFGRTGVKVAEYGLGGLAVEGGAFEYATTGGIGETGSSLLNMGLGASFAKPWVPKAKYSSPETKYTELVESNRKGFVAEQDKTIKFQRQQGRDTTIFEVETKGFAQSGQGKKEIESFSGLTIKQKTFRQEPLVKRVVTALAGKEAPPRLVSSKTSAGSFESVGVVKGRTSESYYALRFKDTGFQDLQGIDITKSTKLTKDVEFVTSKSIITDKGKLAAGTFEETGLTPKELVKSEFERITPESEVRLSAGPRRRELSFSFEEPVVKVSKQDLRAQDLLDEIAGKPLLLTGGEPDFTLNVGTKRYTKGSFRGEMVSGDLEPMTKPITLKILSEPKARDLSVKIPKRYSESLKIDLSGKKVTKVTKTRLDKATGAKTLSILDVKSGKAYYDAGKGLKQLTFEQAPTKGGTVTIAKAEVKTRARPKTKVTTSAGVSAGMVQAAYKAPPVESFRAPLIYPEQVSKPVQIPSPKLEFTPLLQTATQEYGQTQILQQRYEPLLQQKMVAQPKQGQRMAIPRATQVLITDTALKTDTLTRTALVPKTREILRTDQVTRTELKLTPGGITGGPTIRIPPPPPPPPVPGLPFIPRLSLGGSSRSQEKLRGRRSFYIPSLTAAFANLKARTGPTKGLTGFEVRPFLSSAKRRRRRK